MEGLDGEVVQSWHSCTHLVASRIKRTTKFLCALTSAKKIVDLKWIYACNRQHAWIGRWMDVGLCWRDVFQTPPPSPLNTRKWRRNSTSHLKILLQTYPHAPHPSSTHLTSSWPPPLFLRTWNWQKWLGRAVEYVGSTFLIFFWYRRCCQTCQSLSARTCWLLDARRIAICWQTTTNSVGLTISSPPNLSYPVCWNRRWIWIPGNSMIGGGRGQKNKLTRHHNLKVMPFTICFSWKSTWCRLKVDDIKSRIIKIN